MQSRTSYYPIAFSLFAAGLPPEKPLYRQKSRILIEKSLDEDGADAGLGIAGKGLGYYYFGARYCDPELGIWITQDPKLELNSPYAYTDNPISYYDPDGQGLLSWLKLTNPVYAAWAAITYVASAINASMHSGESGGGWKAFFIDLAGNISADVCAPLVSLYTIGEAISTGNINNVKTAIKSDIEGDIATLQNAFSSDNFLEASSNYAQSGMNSIYTSANAQKYYYNPDAKYYGRVSDDAGYTALVWARPSEEGVAYASGHNIVLQKTFFEYDYSATTRYGASRERSFRHEFMHVRQAGMYGTGGMYAKQKYAPKRYANEYTDEFHQAMFEQYGGAESLNQLEYEAQYHELLDEESPYWFDVQAKIEF